MVTPEIVMGAITILAEIARDPLRDQKKLMNLLQAVMESSQRTLSQIENKGTGDTEGEEDADVLLPSED